MKRYDAFAFQDRTWWMVEIPELDIMTQARSRNEVPSQALDLVAVWFGVSEMHVPPPRLRWLKPRHFDEPFRYAPAIGTKVSETSNDHEDNRK